MFKKIGQSMDNYVKEENLFEQIHIMHLTFKIQELNGRRMTDCSNNSYFLTSEYEFIMYFGIPIHSFFCSRKICDFFTKSFIV